MNFVEGEVQSENGELFFEADGVSLPIEREHRTLLDRYVKRPVVLGLRPEDFEENAETETRIEGQVDVIEPLGSETHVFARAGELTFVARLGAQTALRAGSSCSFGVDMARAHFFDPDSEDAIV